MSFLISLKVVRLLLAVAVSVWLAGGCLLGCGSSMAMAAPKGNDSSQAAAEGESCHRAQKHHCCSRPQPAKQSASTIHPKLTTSFLALASLPRDMMRDCPLAMNGTAIASKANTTSPESTQGTNTELLFATGNDALPQKHVIAPLVVNRGPTYLRCCVFLI